MKKICFKCGVEKELTEYYAHKQMGDGHLNKCKDCARKDVDEREKKLRTDPNWVEKEKIRSREKYHRLNYKNIHKPTPERKKEIMKAYHDRYPEKKISRSMLGKTKPKVSGNELHHWSYNIEHAKDVIELTVLDHNKAHRYMIYDQERMMYRRVDTNELLDTRQRHEDYLIDVIQNKI